VGQSRARFEEIRAGERFFARWRATNITSCFGIIPRRLERAAGSHRQLKRVDEQFSLRLFRESCARIDYHLARDWIGGVLFKVFYSRGHRREFLRRNARQFPCSLWRVDLEKREAQFLARTGEHLSGWKDQARFFRVKRRAPARLGREAVTAIAL